MMLLAEKSYKNRQVNTTCRFFADWWAWITVRLTEIGGQPDALLPMKHIVGGLAPAEKQYMTNIDNTL